MVIEGTVCRLRPWRTSDAPALVELANNLNIARNMTGGFPHPYTSGHAESWVAQCRDPIFCERMFAIEHDGQLAGGIGYSQQSDIHIYTADVGYWLGEAFWGRGIATDAVRVFVRHVFAASRLRRLEARIYAWNPASARVLEKAGFTLEGRLRDAVCRFDEFTDALVFGLLREEVELGPDSR